MFGAEYFGSSYFGEDIGFLLPTLVVVEPQLNTLAPKPKLKRMTTSLSFSSDLYDSDLPYDELDTYDGAISEDIGVSSEKPKLY